MERYPSNIPGRRQSSTSDKLRRHTTSHSKASSAHARLHVDAGALKERRAGSECWSWRPVTCGQRMEPEVKAHLLVRQEHISTMAHIILPSAIPVGHNSGRRGDDQPARHERTDGPRGGARDMHDHCMAMQKSFYARLLTPSHRQCRTGDCSPSFQLGTECQSQRLGGDCSPSPLQSQTSARDCSPSPLLQLRTAVPVPASPRTGRLLQTKSYTAY